MDPLTLIMTAIGLGVAGGLTDTTKKAIADIYAHLKQVLQEKHQISLTNLEANPTSEVQKGAIRESLSSKSNTALSDKELITTAQNVIHTVEKHQPQLVRLIIEGNEVGGDSLIEDVHLNDGTSMEVRGNKVKGNSTIKGISLGGDNEKKRMK